MLIIYIIFRVRGALPPTFSYLVVILHSRGQSWGVASPSRSSTSSFNRSSPTGYPFWVEEGGGITKIESTIKGTLCQIVLSQSAYSQPTQQYQSSPYRAFHCGQLHPVLVGYSSREPYLVGSIQQEQYVLIIHSMAWHNLVPPTQWGEYYSTQGVVVPNLGVVGVCCKVLFIPTWDLPLD